MLEVNSGLIAQTTTNSNQPTNQEQSDCLGTFSFVWVMGRKWGRMSPVGRPTAGHKILVVLINAWSKKIKMKKKKRHAHKKNLFYLWRLWRKAKGLELIIMLIVSGGVNEPNETNFKCHRKGRKKISQPSVTQSLWKKLLIFPPHIWNKPEQLRPTLQWRSQRRSQQRSQENLVSALQWVKKKKKKSCILFEWVIWASSKHQDLRLTIIIAYRATAAVIKYPDRLKPRLAAHVNANPLGPEINVVVWYDSVNSFQCNQQHRMYTLRPFLFFIFFKLRNAMCVFL